LVNIYVKETGLSLHETNETMKTVRAKFKCQSVKESEGGYKEVEMMAVMDGDGENGDFNKYTPNGQFKMQISPETKAVDYFEPGKEYYLDFTAAE